LSCMVSMEVADADELDLLRFELELRQLVDDTDLGCWRAGTHRVTGVPEHVVLAMLDEVAAEGERKFLTRVSEGIGKAAANVIEDLRATI